MIDLKNIDNFQYIEMENAYNDTGKHDNQTERGEIST